MDYAVFCTILRGSGLFMSSTAILYEREPTFQGNTVLVPVSFSDKLAPFYILMYQFRGICLIKVADAYMLLRCFVQQTADCTVES